MGSAEQTKVMWDTWEVQVYTSLSLFLQINLIIFGSRRKYIGKTWIKILVWFAYLAAIWTANSALSNLGSDLVYLGGEKTLKALWPPFFLVLLGSPDNITAYSMEDNLLWLRSLLDYTVDIGVAIYVVILGWRYSPISFLAIPIYIVGIIKYGERIFVRYKSSFENFKDSLLSNPDPYPDLVKIKKPYIEQGDSMKKPNEQLFQAFFLFKRFAHLYAGFILEDNEAFASMNIFERVSSGEDAFKLVATELWIMYDVLYTKAIIVYSGLGIFVRFISICLSVSTFVVFVSIKDDLGPTPRIDRLITYTLFGTTIGIEVYGVIALFSSDWATIIRFTKFENFEPIIRFTKFRNFKPIIRLTKFKIFKPIVSCFQERKTWSGDMGQINLIGSCLKDISVSCIGFHTLYSISRRLKNYQYLTWEYVTIDFQKIIFKELSKKIRQNQLRDRFDDIHLRKKILAERGDYVLQKRYELDDFLPYTTEVDFDHSLLLWHIATDLCYYDDFETNRGPGNRDPDYCKISKCLSDYMLYLLIICPYMMPKGIGELRLKDTYANAKRFYEPRKKLESLTKIEARKMLLEEGTDYLAKKDMSVLVEACNLAKKLQELEARRGWERKRKWKMISKVWVEMLAHAANGCDWLEHGYRITKGGELLTHVCLLMAHLGLSQQYNKNGRIID